VEQQLQRYFGATLGLAVAAVWAGVGAGAALSCLVVAGAGYVVTALTQRGALGRIVRASARERRQPRSRRTGGPRVSGPARVRGARLEARPAPLPVAEIDEEFTPAELALEVSRYGW